MRRLGLAGLLVAACFGLNACAGSTDTVGATDSMPSASNARLTIVRGPDLKLGAATANVAVNGSTVANLSPGGSVSLDIPSGPNKISVSSWSFRGQFAATFNATAGARYAVEIYTAERNEPSGPALGPLAAGFGAFLVEVGGAMQFRFIEPTSTGDAVAKVPQLKGRSGG